MGEARLVLYSYYRSTSAWRVRLALHLKALAFEYVPVDLGAGEQHQPGYLARNPTGMVPLLEIHEEGTGMRQVAQSVAIVEYLEDRWPTPGLLPRDLYLRARVRQAVETVNSSIQPFQNLQVQKAVKELGGDPAAWAQRWISRGLAALEKDLAPLAGQYAVGDQVTLADVYLVPQLTGARRMGVDLTPYPLLRRVEEACLALPAFQAAAPDAQPDAPK